jgi:hypothetical protein
VIGNPNIAEVTVQDERTVLIAAKSEAAKEAAKEKGHRTNLILLDSGNQPIYSAEIVVTNVDTTTEPLGRVRVHAGKKIADYIPYACASGDCIRLKEEYQGERSNEIFVPGLRPQSPSINVNTENISAPSPAEQ